MAQPINMSQVPPMANPPIKEQPVYQPFATSSPQIPISDGGFSSGLVWAILALILCCNPLAIASVVLSAIASGEFKRGDIESARKHAKLSKIITIIAVALTLLSAVLVSMVPTEDSEDFDDVIEMQEETYNQLDDTEKKKIVEIIEKDMKNRTGDDIKLGIKPKKTK